MRCYNCGKILKENEKYCLACGHKIGDKNLKSGDNIEGEKEELASKDNTKNYANRVSLPPLFYWLLSIIFILLLLFLILYFD